MKLIHNFVSLGFSAVLSEASACAETTGIDTDVFLDVLSKGGGAGVIFDRLRPFFENKDCSDFAFSLKNATKDLNYYCQMALDFKAFSFTASRIDEVYERAVDVMGGAEQVPKIRELN